MGKLTSKDKLPLIFCINWFRKSKNGKYLWPGFGENSRVLKWVFEQSEGTTKGSPTPVGIIPAPGELDLEGLEIDREVIDQLFEIDKNA